MASLAEKRIDDVEDQIVHTEGQSEVRSEARPEELRLLEALLFASTEPLDQSALAKRMPDGVDIKAALAQLQADYAMRGVNLVRVANKWTFRTAGDLSWLMTRETTETRKLSRAAIEVLAIVAYHQPVTRAEIEDIRGVITSKGTLDVLLETGWIKPRGRRKTPGRPLTFGTTESFLSQFSLEALGDLPGLEELKGTGLLDSRLPSGFSVPNPSDDPTLREDEDPLEGGELELALSAPDPEFPELQLKEPEAGTVGYAGEAQAFAEAKAEFTETADVVEPESEAAEVAELEARDLDVIEPEQGEAEAAEVAEPESDEDETAEPETAELDDDEDDSDDAEDDELDEDDQDEDEPDDAESDATDRDDDRKH
ncbi:SMC-Scp complex subunit ScpB [Tardiphaga robiniae]|uniref:SMC-Scp complex subunit ScpB n=1 Tax=Tardiphaga robiniae TaxID=943830 RepID=A0A7G6TW74_9BRAD|nr:SMC-Scp complex subunit ScpB [Tardiphaga robiniae]QND71006.1 SMC-Scp complex subunit ScpB [Tardiphaga robiniae]